MLDCIFTGYSTHLVVWSNNIIINIIGGNINNSGGSDGGLDDAVWIVSCLSSGMAKGSGLGGVMVLYGGLGGHETSALGPNSIADVGGKIVGGHSVAVMGEPGTDVDGLGGLVVPNENGSGVGGTVAERIVVAMDD